MRFTCLTVCNCDCSFSLLRDVLLCEYNAIYLSFPWLVGFVVSRWVFFLAFTSSAAINTVRGVGLPKRKKHSSTSILVNICTHFCGIPMES